MVAFARSIVLVGAVLLCAAPLLRATREDNEWIVDKMIPNLLRFNLKGELISSDFSEYVKFKCTGEGADRSCDLDSSNMDLTNIEELYKPSDEGTIQSYGTGVALYSAISVAAGIVVIVLTFLYLLCGIFCGVISCCVTSKKKVNESKFSKRTRTIGAATMMGIFFCFLTTVILLCYSVGVLHAFDGITDVSDAPRGAAEITYRFSLATQPTFVEVVSDVMLPTLRDVNVTLNEAVSWPGVLDNLKSLNGSMNRLPNLKHVKDSLETIDVHLTALNNDITGINNFNSDYEDAKQRVLDDTDLVLADMDTLDQALTDMQTAVDGAHDSTVQLTEYWATLFGADGPGSYTATDTDGLVDSVQYDLNRAERSDTPGEGVPTTDTLTDAATGATASMARLLNGDLDGSVSETNELITKLSGIYASVVQLPDFSVTADNLLEVNRTMSEMLASDGVVTSFPTQLNDLQTAIDSLPDIDSIRANVQDMFDAIDSINTHTLSALVDDADTQIDLILGEVDEILGELGKISDVIDSFRAPVRDLMVEQPKNFNRTIMEIPYNLTKLYVQVDDAITSASEVADEATPKLDDVRSQLDEDVDISDFLVNIDKLYDTVDTFDQSERDDITAALDAADIDTTYSATDYTTSIADVRASMVSVGISDTVVEGLVQLQALRYQLELLLAAAVGEVGDVGSDGTTVSTTGEYRLLVQGVCAVDGSTYCSADIDCSSGSCDHIGAYRCAADGSAFTSCTQDSDCTTSCLADSDRATAIQASLLALADPAATSFGEDVVNDNLAVVRTQCASVDVVELESQLDDLSDDIAAADLSSYRQDVQDVQDDLNDPDTDFSEYLGQLTDAQDLIVDVDITDYTGSLDDAQKQIDKYGDKLEDYIRFLDDLGNYVFSDVNGLSQRFRELEKDKLEAVLESDGFGPLLVYIGGTFEGAANDVIDMMNNNTFEQDHVKLKKELKEPARYMDRFTANPHRGFHSMYAVGSLYYMMQLTNQTAEKMIDAADPQANTITTDINGNTYEDGKVCVTKKCFENQQEELEEDYGKYLPALVGLPAIVALIALCNFGCVFVPPKQVGCWRRCMPHWLLCMIIVILPWYLIFSGFFFAFTIGLSDSCTAGPRIAANYIAAYGDDLCTNLGGEGTLHACVFNGNDFDVTLNLHRMSNVALGLEKCSGNADDDPYGVPINTLATQVQSSANKRTDREVSKRKYRKYRSRPKALVTDFSDGSALVAHNFIERIGDDVITCDNVQDIMEYVTTPVCYSVVGPWAWIFATIYLASWTMCCLGIPAACALKNTFKWDDEEVKRELRGEPVSQSESATEDAACDGETPPPTPAPGGEGGTVPAVVVDPAADPEADIEGGVVYAEADDDEKAYLREEGEETFYAPVVTPEEEHAYLHQAQPEQVMPTIISGARYEYSRAPPSEKDAEKWRADAEYDDGEVGGTGSEENVVVYVAPEAHQV